MTAAQLAAALETSERTIYRYIDALGASGVPIVADAGHQGGYTLTEAFRGAPLWFAADELVALFQAALFAHQGGYPYSGALVAALGKVRRNLTPEQEGELSRHTAGFRVQGPQVSPSAPWLEAVEQAVAGAQTLSLAYQKPGNQSPEPRLVDPYGLVYRGGRWYLVGYCHTRRDLREFRVDRIRDLQPSGASFQRPTGFSLEEHLARSDVAGQVKQGPHTAVRLAGEPIVIKQVCEHWYMRHCLVEQGHGEAFFQVDPTGYSHLPGYLFGFGTSIRVLAPDGLRSALASLARASLEHHQKDASHH